MQISLNLDRTVSPHILLKKNCSDLLSFPVSRLYLLNGFDFYFDLFWMAWHLKPAIRHGNGAVWKPEEFRNFGVWFSCGLKTFGNGVIRKLWRLDDRVIPLTEFFHKHKSTMTSDCFVLNSYCVVWRQSIWCTFRSCFQIPLRRSVERAVNHSMQKK